MAGLNVAVTSFRRYVLLDRHVFIIAVKNNKCTIFWWTCGELHPDFRSAEPASSCWTTSPWCRPRVTLPVHRLFRPVCDFYTRAARRLVPTPGFEPGSADPESAVLPVAPRGNVGDRRCKRALPCRRRLTARSPIASPEAWRSLRELDPLFCRDKAACARHTQGPKIMAGRRGVAPLCTGLEPTLIAGSRP